MSSAIFNWLLRHHAAPIPRMMMANGLSLFVATIVGGFGIADGGGPNFASAFASYVLPQLVWLIVGIVRYNRGVGNKLPKIARQAERNFASAFVLCSRSLFGNNWAVYAGRKAAA
jgi:hypothetical protein